MVQQPDKVKEKNMQKKEEWINKYFPNQACGVWDLGLNDKNYILYHNRILFHELFKKIFINYFYKI